MNKIVIELDDAVANVEITEEEKRNGFTTYICDKRVEEIVTNFGNNIINSFSVLNIDGQEKITFKDKKYNSLTFVIKDEKEEYGLNYISYLIDRYNEERKSFYEQEKEVGNINIALSTTGSYYEKANDEMANYVLYVNEDKLEVDDIDFARHIMEELVFNTYQNMLKKEVKNIILIGSKTHLITMPKILYIKIDDLIKKRKKLRKLAFKKVGINNENGRFS